INDSLLVPSFKLEIRLRDRAWRRRLINYWRKEQPDLVVSLMPFVNRLLFKSLQRELPQVPYVTLMTDFADCPPHFWLEPQEQLLICPSSLAVEQARGFGYKDESIFETSGVVIHPRFSQPVTGEPHEARQHLGLDPELPTGLVLFGTQGSPEMEQIAQRLNQSELELQLIFICGRNQQLAADLNRLPTRYRKYVTGFTKELPNYMHLCDFFIGKPGSVGISEAIAMKLPVITECNQTTTLFQERASADWLEDKGMGIAIKNFSEIESAVAKLLQPNILPHYQAKVAAYKNRGVFEAVDILTNILERAYSPSNQTSLQQH
ncbi:MAG: glycosyltransferase, partial [Cyanobacteria bacterium P01_A01_bin.83]